MSSDGTMLTASLANLVYGNYVIESELGRGGMGAVYVGVHQTIGKKVAIKVLLPALSQNKDLVQRFFNEARAATQVKHAGIVEVHDFGHSADGNAYIVMEYLQGESLASRLRSVGRLPVANAVAIARQTANALGHAHRAGIVHRDLKPDNVYLVPDVEVVGGERVKLLDFGIAKLADSNQPGTARTVTGAILGTPQYMSPEQCEGSRTVDHRTDLYALGCMLFEMLAGRLPFTETGIGGLIGAHLHMPPPRLRSIDPALPDSLDAIVDRLLAKSPDARFASGEEVANALSDPAFGALTAPRTIPPMVPSSSLVAPTVPPTQVPSSPPMVATQMAGPPPALATPVPTSGSSVPPKKKRWPLVVGLVALLGGGAAAFAIVSSRKDDKPKITKADPPKDADGAKTDGAQADPVKADPSKTDSTRTDGTTTDNTKTDGTKTDGVKTDGTKTDGTKTDGTKTDPAKTDKNDPLKTEPEKKPEITVPKPKDTATSIKEAYARGQFVIAGTACRSLSPGEHGDLIIPCIVSGCRGGRIPMARQWVAQSQNRNLVNNALNECLNAGVDLADRQRPLRPQQRRRRPNDKD